MREWYDIYKTVQSDVHEELIEDINKFNPDEKVFDIVDDLVDEYVSFRPIEIKDYMDIIQEETNVFNDEKLRDSILGEVYNQEFSEVLLSGKYEESDKYQNLINKYKDEEVNYDDYSNREIGQFAALLYEYDSSIDEVQDVANAALEEFEVYITGAVKGNLEKEFSVDENFTVGDLMKEIDKNKTLDERIAEVQLKETEKKDTKQREIEER